MTDQLIEALERRIQSLEATVALLSDPTRNAVINISADTFMASLPDVTGPAGGAAQAAAAQLIREGAALVYDSSTALVPSDQHLLSVEELAAYMLNQRDVPQRIIGSRRDSEHYFSVPIYGTSLSPEAESALRQFLNSEQARQMIDGILSSASGSPLGLSEEQMRAEIAVEWEPIREEWVNQFLASQWGGDVAHLITSSMNSISESGQDVYTYALQMSNMSETLRGMDDLLQALTILGDQGAQSLIDLVQHPALVNILLSSQGSPDGLYTQILSNPALIQELASSPLMPQVLTEVFRSELIQETLVSELFGDIEAEDSPIRTALASALGDLASDDNPIAQALINGILSGGEEEGASLGGAVRQIVQDTLRGTDETAVLPTLDRIDLRLNETEISLQQQNALIRMLEARANGVDARLRSLEGRVSQLGHTPAGADNNNIRRDPDTGMANLRNNPR